MKTSNYFFTFLNVLASLCVAKDDDLVEPALPEQTEPEEFDTLVAVTSVSSSSSSSSSSQESSNVNSYPAAPSSEAVLVLERSDSVSISNQVEELPPSFLRPRFLQDDDNDASVVGFWPFGHRDKNTSNTDSSSSSCASQTDCESCIALSSWCHWCENQNSCHSRGSFYGCFSGSQCNSGKKNHTVDPDDQHGCAAHMSCQECATASRFCHWCAHDQACHAIGSVYGCSYGVDCFSNDRCKRSAPERLPRHGLWHDLQKIDALPVAIVTAVAVLICGCATLCFCCCSGVKGAYDDLADLSAVHDQDDDDPMLTEPLLDSHGNEQAVEQQHEQDDDDDGHDDNDGPRELLEQEESFVSALEEGEAPVPEDPPTEEEQDDNQQSNAVPAEETDPLLTESLTVPVSHVHHRSIRPRRPRHMQRLYNACRACYIVTVFLMCTMVFMSIRFYPQIPVYNICNDDVAWKSIIDSMKTMHTEADFEILASLSNPNHISVALDKGTGFFHHNGKFAGTFTIPPFTAEAMSITDILIIAHLKPGTWDAIQIATEYERGKLILHVNTTVVIRVPALADFTYEGGMDDIEVNVNEINDRSLCACPSWDEAKNHSRGVLLDQDNALSLELPVVNEQV